MRVNYCVAAPLEEETTSGGLSSASAAGIAIGVLIFIVLVVVITLVVLHQTGVVDVKKQANDTKVMLGFSNMNYDEEKAGASSDA